MLYNIMIKYSLIFYLSEITPILQYSCKSSLFDISYRRKEDIETYLLAAVILLRDSRSLEIV